MSDLRVSASGFTGDFASLNQTHKLTVSKPRCTKAAMTIGIPLLKLGAPGWKHALVMGVYKALAVKAAIDFVPSYLTRPWEYTRLDSSEKSNLSYWTGMTFATLAANDLLQVPRLLHAAAATDINLMRTNPRSRSLADLVGQDMDERWRVVEAKARQRSASGDDRAKWKDQARTIDTIDGVAPATRSYCLTNVGDIYSAELVDPIGSHGSLDLDRTAYSKFTTAHIWICFSNHARP